VRALSLSEGRGDVHYRVERVPVRRSITRARPRTHATLGGALSMIVTRVDSDWFVDGKEMEFNDIQWAKLTPEQFEACRPLFLSDFQRNQAERKRGVKQVIPQMKAIVVNPDVARYEEMARKNDPDFPAYKTGFADGNFWYWFGTFWKEMPKSDRLPVLQKLVEPSGELKPAWDFLKTKDTNALDQESHNKIKGILKDEMMKKGFTDWSKKGKLEPSAKILPTIDALGKQEFRVGFRGDARDYTKLLEHDQGAFQPKVKTKFAVQKYNLSASWNPFSDDDVKNAMWWREGQADNDLYTVVSVAKDFATSTKFPLIDDPGPDLTIWPQGAKLILRPPGQKSGEFAQQATVSRMHVYLMRVAGDVYDTQSHQAKASSFPEVGVASVPADDVVARMQILRIHYGNAGDDGHLVFVEDYNLIHEHARKQLYQKSDETGTVMKFIDHMVATYYRQFFQYNTVTSPTLLHVEKCSLIETLYLNIYNRELATRVQRG
jgi:hypothetical protein